MTLVTLRPNSSFNGWAVTGASAHAATSDDSDATLIQSGGPAGNASAIFFALPVVPVTDLAKSLAVRARVACLGTTAFQVTARLTGNVLFGLDTASPSQEVARGVAVTHGTPTTITVIEAQGLFATTGEEPDTISATLEYAFGGAIVVYELYADFVYVVQPNLTVDAPTGIVGTTNFPTVAWTPDLDADGGPQQGFEVKIFDAATFGDFSGVDPDTTPPFTESGEAVAPGTSAFNSTAWQTTELLPDGDYRAYVRIAQGVNGEAHWSGWESSDFTMDVAVPEAPALTLTPQNELGRIRVVPEVRNSIETAGVNLITNNGFEVDTSGWVANVATATIQRVTTEHHMGIAALQVNTDGTANNQGARTESIVVAPNRTYTFEIWVKCEAATGNLRILLQELDSSNVEIGDDKVDFAPTGEWQRVSVTRAFGAGVRARCRVGTDETASQRTIFVDQASLVDVAETLSNSSFEENLDGWTSTAPASATITRVSTEHRHGSWSQRVDSNGGSAQAGTRTASIPISPSETHTFTVFVKGTAGATLRAQLQELTVGEVVVDTTNEIFTATGEWQPITVTRAFGATGVLARCRVVTDSAQTTTFYVDYAVLTEGPAVPTDQFQIQRSDDGGATWRNLRTTQAGGIVPPISNPQDYEAANGGLVRYRARALHHFSDGDSFSEWVEADVLWESADAWLKHPYQPWLNTVVTVYSLPNRRRAPRAGKFQPLGRTCAVFVSDKRGPAEGDLILELDTEGIQASVDAMLDTTDPLLLQLPAGKHWPDRWLIFTDHNRARMVDKLDVEDTHDTLPWTAVQRPDGNLISFSLFEAVET